MEARELRLQAVLKFVGASAPTGPPRDKVYRWDMIEKRVAIRTAREDLQDLEMRGLVEFRVGHVYLTARGRKRRLGGF